MGERPAINMKPRTILHIGAGDGKRLADWQKLQPEKIVLVEPERMAVSRLRQQAVTQSNVVVIQAALGQVSGEAELSTWNFSRLNSTREPAPVLHELFPGLTRKERQVVPVITPARLMSEIGAVARPLFVIMEMPGIEMDFLAACKADGVLDQIDRIEILAAEEAVYDGASNRAALESWLLEAGFVVTARDNSDADWTVLHLASDQAARALSKAEASIEALTKNVKSLETALSDAKAQLTEESARAARLETALSEARAATDAKTKALADRDAALKAEKGRSEGLQAVLTEARAATEAKSKALAERDEALKAAKERAEGVEVALSEARAATDAKTKALAERDAELKAEKGRSEGLQAVLTEARAATEAKSKALTEREAALKAAQERAEGLEAALSEARALREETAKTLADREAALQAASEKVSGLEAEKANLAKQRQSAEQKRDDAMSTLDFQTRFQAMLQVDLENLRSRLERSETQRQLQEDLLGKLTSKLSLAAEYLRQLPPNAQESLTPPSSPELASPRRRSSGKKQKTKAAQGRGA